MSAHSVRRRLVVVALVVIGVIIALVTVSLVMVSGAEPAGSLRGVLRYDGPGEYGVGYRVVTLRDEPALEAAIWYPAEVSATDHPVSYVYGVKLFPPLGDVAIGTYRGLAVRAAPIERSGPYPVVILSPGFGIGSPTYGWLAEHIASYGFVVASPDHREQLDPARLWRATIDRPADIRASIRYLPDEAGTDGWLSGRVRGDAIAVVGHSYGGYTALAAAGARLDTAGFAQTCRDPNAAISLAFLCDALLPHVAEMATEVGLEAIPAGVWPAFESEEIDAVVSLAGDAAMFGGRGLARLRTPVLAIGRIDDKDSPYAWGTGATFRFSSSRDRIEVGLIGARHFIFTGPCERMRLLLKLLPTGFCSDPGWLKDDAHAVTRHLTVAFLLAELNQEQVAAVALRPSTFNLSDITYQAEGFDA